MSDVVPIAHCAWYHFADKRGFDISQGQFLRLERSQVNHRRPRPVLLLKPPDLAAEYLVRPLARDEQIQSPRRKDYERDDEKVWQARLQLGSLFAQTVQAGKTFGRGDRIKSSQLLPPADTIR